MVDALLYVALVVLSLRALWSTDALLGADLLAPIVVVLGVLGLRDKTVFLAARAEHYWVTLIVLWLAGSDVVVALAGAMVVQLCIWWGAATSKVNHHFPNVVTIMVSNSPFLGWGRLRRAMYRSYPEDLRPSWVPTVLAHGGTAVEYLFPLLLAVAAGGRATAVGLAVMLAFHVFITSCFPMGVPLEWNVLFLYSMFVLFGEHADLSPLDVIGDPVVAALLVVGILVGPVLGNLRPDLTSFLPGMRYYAGNWAAGAWLYRKGVEGRVDECITKTARTIDRQLALLYDEDTIRAVNGKLRAFRSMHLHGRALTALLPRAVDDLEAYRIDEGEGQAGVVLGWNFGDGHLHHEQLLAAVQARCRFAPGDLRVVLLESQPINRPWLHWRIVDAATGLVEEGRIRVADLRDHQPWPAPDSVDVGALPAR